VRIEVKKISGGEGSKIMIRGGEKR